MAGTDDNPTRPSRARWGVRLLMTAIALMAIPCTVLLIITFYLNFAARIPRSMRAEPAAIAAIRNRPTAIETPRINPPASAKISTKAQAAVESMKKPYWDRSFYELFGGHGGGYGPLRELNVKQRVWLKSNQSLIESIRSLIAEGESTPVYLREMIVENNRASWGSEPQGFVAVACIATMLTADAQYQLEQAQYGKARASLVSVLGLVEFCIRDNRRSRATLIDQVVSLCVPLVNAIQTKSWPVEEWAGIPETLERVDALVFDVDALEKELADEYTEQRGRLVHDLDGPWTAPIFGWQPTDASLYYTTDLYWMNGSSVWVPRPVRFVGSVAKAMSMKRRSAEMLKKNDETRLAFIKLLRMPYSVRMASPEWMLYARFRDEPISSRSPMTAAVRFTPAETSVHLARLGLLWRLDLQKAESLRAQDLKPHNPWHDPFSEKPFMVDETSGTLIYSASPDLDPQKSREKQGCSVRLP